MQCIHFQCDAACDVVAQSSVPAGEFHQDQHCYVDEEVKQRQLVHLLPNACFPALRDPTGMTRQVFL